MHIKCTQTLIVAMLLAIDVQHASATTRDSFETFETSWRIEQRDCVLAMDLHHRAFDKARSGQASEHFSFRCGRGTKIYLTHAIAPARVIDELAPSVWVNSERPGVRMLVRVVLPRSEDPTRGGPMSTMLPGPVYQNVGSWQQLRLTELTKRLQREVRLLRTRFGSDVDIREAYIDLIVLNAYSGPGPSHIWIDDLEIEGHVSTRGLTSPDSHTRSTPVKKSPHLAGVESTQRTYQINGTVLEIAGRPMFLRMIDYNGERLEELKSLGFDAIKLDRPPTADLNERAKRSGMSIVSPAPLASDQIVDPAAFDRIVAWTVEQGENERDLESMRSTVKQTRKLPDELQRPIACDDAQGELAVHRLADVLFFKPRIADRPFERTGIQSWIEHRNRDVRPKKPIWVSVPVDTIRLSASDPPTVDQRDFRDMALQAIASGSRGLAFQSSSSLDVPDAATKSRALALRLLNEELDVLAPWAAGATIRSKIQTNDPEVDVSVLQTERSRLLFVRRKRSRWDGSAEPDRNRKLSFVDEGASDSSMVYEISPARGIQPIRHERKPSGIRIILDKLDSTRILVITHDPLVVEHISHQSLRITQMRND